MTLLEAIDTDKSLEAELGKNIHKLPNAEATSRQPENGNCELSGIGTSLRQMLERPTREIDALISQLEMVRNKLQTDANRIQRDIVEYAELSLHVMQLTPIISDAVKKPSSSVSQQATNRVGDP
jgi:hypothetical protein